MLNYRFFALLPCAVALIAISVTYGQTPSGQVILLWPEGVPDCPTESAYAERWDAQTGRRTGPIVDPQMEWFAPPKDEANGGALLICPGGGYRYQAYDKEGTRFARWLSARGFHAFVLQYRLPAYTSGDCRGRVALDDAQRAMTLIRKKATSYGIQSNRIGVLGFSAGGHLAASLSNRSSSAARPNFAALVYPVISSDSSIWHAGSIQALVGTNANKADLRLQSCDLQITKDTPPTFLTHAEDDTVVVPANTWRYYQALRQQEIPVTLHLFQRGGHGFGMADQDPSLATWLQNLEGWLQMFVD